MIIIGIIGGIICLFILILAVSEKNKNKKMIIWLFSFIVFFISCIYYDISAPEKLKLISIVETNRIPINVYNLNGISLTVKQMEDNYVYTDKQYKLYTYDRTVAHPFFIFSFTKSVGSIVSLTPIENE